MKWQYKLEENRKVHNSVYLAIIVLLSFSLFFSNSLSILLKLKPNYKFSNDTEIHFINVGQGDAVAVKFDKDLTHRIVSPCGLCRYIMDKMDLGLNVLVIDKNDMVIKVDLNELLPYPYNRNS